MRVCLFDIDGTLIQSGGAGMGALKEAMIQAFGIEPPVQQVPVHGRTDRAIAADLFTVYSIEQTDANWQRFRTAYLEALPRLLVERDGDVLPGIGTLLDLLRSQDDIRLGLLTGNTRAGAEIKLGHYGLNHYFSFGGFGDLHHDRDDVARAAFANARSLFGSAFDPDTVWVIGDTPADVRCGRAIGARVVAVATGQHTLEDLQPTNADHLIPNLADPATWRTIWGVGG